MPRQARTGRARGLDDGSGGDVTAARSRKIRYHGHTIETTGSPFGVAACRIHGPLLNGCTFDGVLRAKRWIRQEEARCANCRHERHAGRDCASPKEYGRNNPRAAETGPCTCKDYLAQSAATLKQKAKTAS